MATSQKERNPDMGERARIRREKLGLSKTDLAQILGVGTTRITQMEQHGVDQLSTVRRWADALGLDPVDLVFETHTKTKRSTKKGSK